jgi:TolB-like protein/DNA-binding winged helix-turn-helix (wHTH) protein
MNEIPQNIRAGGPALVDHLDIAGLTLDLRREELRDGAGVRIELRNRSFGVLRHLSTNAGRVVTKDELLEANWPGVTVTEDSLTQCISEIRRALGDAGRDLIRTVPRRGYMVVLPERPPIPADPIAAQKPADQPAMAEPAAASWYQRLPVVIPTLLSLVLVIWGAWMLTTGLRSFPAAVPAPPVTALRGPVVAVLPFENNTGDTAQDMLADGLTQAMISALGRFDHLLVLARGVTSVYKGRVPNTTDLGRTLGADYAIDGNLRRDGDGSRIDIQLSDARTGVQVWSKTFAAAVGAGSPLAVQDEISGQASAMIGSHWGAIGAAEYKRIRTRPGAELTPYECIVQGVVGTSVDITVSEPVAQARDCLERLTRDQPGNAAAWAAIVLVYNIQRNSGFTLPPEEAAHVNRRLYLAPKALAAANRAIELAPNDAFVRGLAARAAWMACQPDMVHIEALRAITLNPNDPGNLGPLGNLVAFAGFWDEGASIAAKGIALTAPSTPRWWWWTPAKGHWFRGEYRPALEAFRQSYVEQLWLSRLHMAYALPFLDRVDEAKAHVAALLKMKPQFTIREADDHYRMWCFPPSYREKMRDALRIAGLPE